MPHRARDTVSYASAEHRVDIVLRCVAGIAREFRAIQQPGVADAIVDGAGRVRLDGIDAAPDIHHDGDVVLDEFHRRHHLADALAGEILEIACLEERDHALLYFLAEQPLLVRRGNPGQRRRGLIDRLRLYRALLRLPFGAADHD